MTKESAINYLKLLHSLEDKFSQDLFSTDLKGLAQKLRMEFIKAYNNKGVSNENRKRNKKRI